MQCAGRFNDYPLRRRNFDMPLNLDEALKQQAIAWLVRLRADDLSDEDMSAFAYWLAQDGRHSEAFAYAEDLFDDMLSAATAYTTPAVHSLDRAPAPVPVADFQPVPSRPAQQSAVRSKPWISAGVAIAAAWLFAVILVMPESSHPLDRLLSDYHTETGELRNVPLADGSQLLLNTNSAVSIDYAASRRRVILHHGQARFTVAKDSRRPFEVLAGDLNVRALGTEFDVYRPESDDVSVTVQRHAVKVDTHPGARSSQAQNGQANTFIVQVGQNLRYRHDSSSVAVRQVQLEQATAWQQRRLFINDRPLGELIAELNRYRVGRIFLSDAQLSQLRVTGVFSLDNPDDIVRAVSDGVGLRATRLGPLWVLLHR